MNPNEWTYELPAVTGWYWTRNHHGRVEVVQVVPHPKIVGELCVMENSWAGWTSRLIRPLGLEWSGPITPPAGPERPPCQ